MAIYIHLYPFIVDFPIDSMVISNSYVSLPEGTVMAAMALSNGEIPLAAAVDRLVDLFHHFFRVPSGELT